MKIWSGLLWKQDQILPTLNTKYYQIWQTGPGAIAKRFTKQNTDYRHRNTETQLYTLVIDPGKACHNWYNW